jgi:hypothetical protein
LDQPVSVALIVVRPHLGRRLAVLLDQSPAERLVESVSQSVEGYPVRGVLDRGPSAVAVEGLRFARIESTRFDLFSSSFFVSPGFGSKGRFAAQSCRDVFRDERRNPRRVDGTAANPVVLTLDDRDQPPEGACPVEANERE